MESKSPGVRLHPGLFFHSQELDEGTLHGSGRVPLDLQTRRTTVSELNPTLTRESDLRSLLRLALPIIGMTVSRMLMGFIDFVMVSMLGTEAQAAISPATIFVFVIACIGMGAAQAVQTFVSQADGRGEPGRAGAYTWQSIHLALISIVFTLPLALYVGAWYGPLGHMAQHPPAVTALEVAYLSTALWSIPPSVACAGLQGFFNGVQKSGIALIAILISLVANVIGNWALMFGHLGLPEMGIAGAGLATAISWTIRAAVMFGAMLLPKYHARFNTRDTWRLHLPYLRDLIRVGGPTSVQWLVDIGSVAVFLGVMMPFYGKVEMAAANIAIQYMHLAFMPAIGIGIALCSQVGFAIGEGQPDAVARKTRVAMNLTGSYMAVIGVLLFALRGFWMRLFNDDPAVIDAGGWVMIWVALFQVFDAMGITYMNALRGAGDTRVPAIITFVLAWGLFVGGGLAVTYGLPQFGINGPWFMFTLYIAALGLLLKWRFDTGHWRNIRLFDQPQAAREGEPIATAEPAPVMPPAAVLGAED